MLKISAILALVAACSAIPVPQQYFTIAQQPQFAFGQQNGLNFGQPQYYTLGQGSGLQYVNGGAFGGQTILVAAAPAPAPAVRQVVVRPAPVPAPAPVVVVKAAPAPPAPEPTAYPQYSYSYKVDDAESGDHKEASETRDGDSVSGKYSLVEPDGTLRTVTYTADKDNGFQATVQRDAPAAPVQPTRLIVQAPAPAKRVVVAAQPAPAVQYVTLQQAPAFQTVQYPQVQTIQVAQAPVQTLVQRGPVAQVNLSSPNAQYSYVH